MKFRVKASKCPSREFRRVCTNSLREALSHLDQYPDEDSEGLHEARKDIKQTRSVLMLLRYPQARPEAKRLNGELREIAHLLAGPRDNEVLTAILEAWRQKVDASENPVLHQAIANLLDGFRQTGNAHPHLDPATRSAFRKRILSVADSIMELPLDSLTWKRVRKSAHTRQARMRNAYLAYLREPNAETLHTWRKRVKEHMYHLELLKPLHLSTGNARRKIKKLEQHLGASRDYDLLLVTIRRRKRIGLTIEEFAFIAMKAEQKKSRCLRKALNLAERYGQPAQNE